MFCLQTSRIRKSQSVSRLENSRVELTPIQFLASVVVCAGPYLCFTVQPSIRIFEINFYKTVAADRNARYSFDPRNIKAVAMWAMITHGHCWERGPDFSCASLQKYEARTFLSVHHLQTAFPDIYTLFHVYISPFLQMGFSGLISHITRWHLAAQHWVSPGGLEDEIANPVAASTQSTVVGELGKVVSSEIPRASLPFQFFMFEVLTFVFSQRNVSGWKAADTRQTINSFTCFCAVW